MSVRQWDGFINNAKAFVATGQLEELEVNYKIEAGKNLGAAREAVLSGADGWADLVMKGVRSTGGMIYSVQQARFRDWLNGSSDKALEGLQAIWTEEDLSAPERVRGFVQRFPPDTVDTRGVGTRTRLLSVLLMGLDAKQYPPFAIMAFTKAYTLTGYDKPESGADEATQYGHALGFLDRFIEEARKRGLTLNNRLEAQSVVWRIQDVGIETCRAKCRYYQRNTGSGGARRRPEPPPLIPTRNPNPARRQAPSHLPRSSRHGQNLCGASARPPPSRRRRPRLPSPVPPVIRLCGFRAGVSVRRLRMAGRRGLSCATVR